MGKKEEVYPKLKKYSNPRTVAEAVELSTTMVKMTLRDERNNDRIVDVAESLVNLIENFQIIVRRAGKDFNAKKTYYVPTKSISED